MMAFEKLLVVALKPEWSFLKQNFRFQKINSQLNLYKISSKNTKEQIPPCALLQIGVGLEMTKKSVSQFLESYETKSVLHFGTAGALTSDLKVGDLFLANQIMNTLSLAIHCKTDLKNPEIKPGTLLTVNSPLKNQKEKISAYEKYQAQAVDMESFSAVNLFNQKHIPYYSVRGIFDELTDNLEDIGEPYHKTGELSALKLSKNLIRSPKQILTLPKLQKKMSLIQKNLLPVILKYLEFRS